jgi:tellurite resistance protein
VADTGAGVVVKIDPSGNMTTLADVPSAYGLLLIGDILVVTRKINEKGNVVTINTITGTKDYGGYEDDLSGYPLALDIAADPFNPGQFYLLTSEVADSEVGYGIEHGAAPSSTDRAVALDLGDYEKPRGLLVWDNKKLLFALAGSTQLSIAEITDATFSIIAPPSKNVGLYNTPKFLSQDPISGHVMYSMADGTIGIVDISTERNTLYSKSSGSTASNNEGPFSTMRVAANSMYFDRTNKRLLVTSDSGEVVSIEYGCPDGYTGSLCTVPICYGISADDEANVCGGNGDCVGPNNCQCNDGSNLSKSCIRLKQAVDVVTVKATNVNNMVPSGTGTFFVCVTISSENYVAEIDYTFAGLVSPYISVESCGSMALYGKSLYMAVGNQIISVNITAENYETIAGDNSAGTADGFGSEASFTGIQDLQVSRDGRFLWVLELRSSLAFRKVSLFQNYKVTTQTPIMDGSTHYAYSFVIDLDDNIVFASYAQNKIWKFSLDNSTATVVTDSITNPYFLELDPQTGNLFVGNTSHIIHYIDGASHIIAGASGQAENNIDGFVSSITTIESSVLTYDSYSNRLVFTTSDVTVRAVQFACPKRWTGLNCDVPLCNGNTTCNNGGTCDSPNQCTCSDNSKDTVRFCGNPDVYRGNVTVLPGTNIPHSVAINPVDGSLYFTDYNNGKVMKYNFDGANPTEVKSIPTPRGLIFGYQDDILILFVTTGHQVVTINIDNLQVTNTIGTTTAGYSAGKKDDTRFTLPQFLVTDPYDPNTVYIGTERAIFRLGSISLFSSLIIGDVTKNEVVIAGPSSSSIYNYTSFTVNAEGTFMVAHPDGILYLSPYYNNQNMQLISPSAIAPPTSFIVAAELGLTFGVYPTSLKAFTPSTYKLLSEIDLHKYLEETGYGTIQSGVYYARRNTLTLVLSAGKMIEVTLDGEPEVATSPSAQHSSLLDASSVTEESSYVSPVEMSSAVPEDSLFPSVHSSSPQNSASVVEESSSHPHASPSTFPQPSVHPSKSVPVGESSPEPVESSPDNTPVVTEFIPMIVSEPKVSDICGSLALFADLKRSDVVDTTFRWFISRNGESVFVGQTTNSETVTVPFETNKPGKYDVYVSVDGTVNKHLLIKGNSTYTFTKLDNQFGPKCAYNVRYETSFGNLPEEGQRLVVKRSSKLYIKTFTNAPSVITYKWIAPLNRRSLLADTTNLMITDPSATGIALQFPGGDMDVTVTLEISLGNNVLFTKQLAFVSSPSRPFDVPSNKYNGFEVISDLVKDPKIKYNGMALKTLFTLNAIGWTKRYATEEFVFIFSYFDATANRYVPLATNGDGTVTTTLPVGYGSRHKLKLQLTVQNNWDDTQSVTQEVIVISRSIQDDAISVSSMTQKLITSSNETDFISGTIAVAAYISQNAYRISGATKEIFQGVINELLDHTSFLILNSTNGHANETTLQQQIAVVDVLTKASTIVSDQGKEKALDIMRSVIALSKSDNGTAATMTIGLSTYKEIAHVISNVVGGGFTNEQVATKTILTANEMARAILNQKLVTEEASTVVSDNFELVVKSDRAHAFDNSRIETQNSDTGSINVVQIPGNFAYDVVSEASDVVSYTMLVFKKNPFQYAQAQQQRDIASSVVDLTFHHENGSAIAVRNLTAPLQLMISKPKRCDVLGERATFTCRYWDEEHNVWSTDGCYWVPEASTDSAIACHCNHTTSFSAFILHKGKCPEKTPGMSISGIIFNTAYVALCVPILVALFITRNTQPVRSRYIAPFIGIIAILVDSVLQGWINNSLALAEQWNAMDAFSYVIMMTSNPLAVAALFVFLWQQVRFVLLQNIYYLMGSSASLHKKIMLICRVITSKLIFCLATLTVSGFVLCYFAALVAVAATRKTGIQTDRVIVAQAVSFASFILVIALGIALMLLVDVFMSFRRSKEETVGDSGADVIQVNQKKGIAVIAKNLTDDALYFRFEACLILLAVLIMFILYPIGIASVVKESPAKSGLSVVRLLIEFIFMFVKIVAFGGFVCGIAVKNYFMPGEATMMEKIQQEDPEMNIGDDKILSVLRNEAGYRVVTNYCRIEFSLENLLLWQELEELRANNLIMSTSERKSALQQIDEMYVQRNSEREFNCSNSVKKTFQRALDSKEPSVVETEEAFAALYGACMHNIADTFTRITSTKPYIQFIKGREMEHELKSTVQ